MRARSPNRAAPRRKTLGGTGRGLSRRGLALAVITVMLSSCTWRGVANVALPGGPGTGPGHLTIYLQMPDTLALNTNSRVLVRDVYVGTVRSITLKNWVATLTLDVEPNVKLPVNVLAKIGQTSLLGTQHIELDTPPNPSPQRLKSGDTIPLKNSSAYPTIERTLAAFSVILNGGGIPNLEVIQNEILNIVGGRADEIREFLNRLDTFATELNRQRDVLTRAIDSSNQLLSIVADHKDTLDRLLSETELPALAKHFADTRNTFGDAVEALGRYSELADKTLSAAQADLHENLQLLQPPLKQLVRAAPYLVNALRLILSIPFDVDAVPKLIRGDFINASGTVDLTLSALDNALLTGTGFSGALRALEQSWGRDPNTMIPDVRFTPNPNDAPGGPLVERGQ
jgi:phospholipid/cholesterol/gamma-HCH transport system substrate-binding protein